MFDLNCHQEKQFQVWTGFYEAVNAVWCYPISYVKYSACVNISLGLWHSLLDLKSGSNED